MKKVLLIAVTLFCWNIYQAQNTDLESGLKKQNSDTLQGWKLGGVFSSNFTQTSLTNWSAGGENALSLNSLLSVFANYRKGKSTWDNSLDLAYGFLKSGDADIRKTDDRIDFTSKYGREAVGHWYYAGLLNFKSQLTAGYNYPNDSVEISNFLAPGYVLAAIGMDYKPNDVFTVFISPITSKTTIVNDQTLSDQGAFGVDPGKTIRVEYGGYLRGQFNKDIMENINLQTRLELFSNYVDEPLHIDVNWEVLVAMKVNKYISATISTQLLYDHDIDIVLGTNDDGTTRTGPRVQFKEVLGVGLTYKF